MQLNEIDEKILFFLKEGIKKRKEILVFLRREHSEVTDHQLRRSLERLIDQQLIDRKRYSIYGLTKEGRVRTEGVNLDSESLFEEKEVAKVLKRLPLHLQAFTSLYLCGIIARRHLRGHYEEGFPSFLICGKKGVGKTRSARLVFRLLRLDFEKHSRYVPNASPGELGLRRYKEKGRQEYMVRSSSYFDKPAFCFEELGRAQKPIKDALWVYFQGNRSYLVEGKQIEHRVCAVMTSNLSPQEMKIPDGIYRRTPILNTDAIGKELEDVDVIFRKLLRGRLPYLDLAKLKPKVNKLTDGQYQFLRTLLNKCVTEDAWQYKVDTESTVILSLAMQALLRTESIEQATLFTLYYRLLLLETTGDTVENWKEILFAAWKKVGGLQEEIGLEKEKERVEVSLGAPPDIKVAQKLKKIEGKLSVVTKFEPQQKEITALLDKTISEIQGIRNGTTWQFLTLGEQEKFNVALNAFNVLKEIGSKIRKGDWDALEALEKAFWNTNKDQYLPLIELCGKGDQRDLIQSIEKHIELYAALPEEKWDRDKWNSLKELQAMITDNSVLTEEQKERLKESFPKMYYEMPDKLRAAEEATQRSEKREREISKKIEDVLEAIEGKRRPEKESRPPITAEPKRELNARTPVPPTTPPPRRSIPSGKPIGRAEYFSPHLRRWVDAEIWKYMPDSLGRDKFLIKWEDALDREWVPREKLHEIQYFNQ